MCSVPASAVKVVHRQRRQLAEAAAGRQRGPHQVAELALRGVDQPAAFLDRQVAQPCRVGFLERLDPSPRRVWRRSGLRARLD